MKEWLIGEVSRLMKITIGEEIGKEVGRKRRRNLGKSITKGEGVVVLDILHLVRREERREIGVDQERERVQKEILK